MPQLQPASRYYCVVRVASSRRRRRQQTPDHEATTDLAERILTELGASDTRVDIDSSTGDELRLVSPPGFQDLVDDVASLRMCAYSRSLLVVVLPITNQRQATDKTPACQSTLRHPSFSRPCVRFRLKEFLGYSESEERALA